MAERDSCPAARRPRRFLYLVVAVIAASLVIAVYLSYTLLTGLPRTVSVILEVLLAAGLFIDTFRRLRRHETVLIMLCERCGSSPVYIPRRLAYICRSGDSLLCYSSANDVLYTITVEEKLAEEPFDPWRSGLDFYCVKPLEGSYDKSDGKTVFRGEFLAIDPDGPQLVRARGTVERITVR